MLRWGVGVFPCVIAALGGKNWYWMHMERLAMTREIKRGERPEQRALLQPAHFY